MVARINLLILLSVQLSYDSCSHGQKDSKPNKIPIARVQNQYLYKHDLDNIGIDIVNPGDSVALVERYIQSWVAKQLLIAKAEEQEEYNKADIERKILDYRYALIVHSLIEKLVNDRLNRAVSDEDIRSYYQKNKDNFKLNKPIFQGQCIVLPKDAPNQAKLRTLLTANQAGDRAALTSYCCQFAKDYALNDSVWLSWEDIIKKTPFNKLTDPIKLLQRTKLAQTQDDEYIYYLKIKAYKLRNDIAPLAYVSNQIGDIIIYKKKIALANQIQEDILQQAKVNKDYTIYAY